MSVNQSIIFCFLIFSCSEKKSEYFLSGSEEESSSAAETSGSTSGSSGSGFDNSGSGGMSGSVGFDRCGDAVIDVDLGEECDGGERCNDCLIDRLVFVTKYSHKGNLGGIEIADELCNKLIVNSSNPWITPEDFIKEKRIMKAFLSDSNNNPFENFNMGKGRYVRIDNEIITLTGNDLLNNKLLNPINTDEEGNLVNDYVWTNTNEKGLTVSDIDNCENWTDDSVFFNSFVGWSGSSDSNWVISKSGINPRPCSAEYHIYCVEVIP